MRTSVYVDGFNLYYGAVKGTPYKWLDHRILTIKYFTAGVSGKLDPRPPIRQQTYWRAIRSHKAIGEGGRPERSDR